MSKLFWIVPGLCWTLALPGAPWTGTSLFLLALALAALGVRPFLKQRRWRQWSLSGALLLTAAAWAGWQVETGLAARWDQPPALHTLTGTVISLPERRGERLSFRFAPEAQPAIDGLRQVEVRWFRPTHTPRVGETWQLRLRLAPPRDRLNFGAGDPERHWFAERVDALGSVVGDGASRQGPAQGHPVQRLRERIRDRFAGELAGLPGHGLVLALSLGDRSLLGDALREAMRATGTGHLLAISGLHVGLVALFGTRLARLGLGLLGGGGGARRVAPLFGLMLAGAYALLAGFGTSPRRALVMVSVVVIALVLRRRVGPWRSWLIALAAVLAMDPLAPLQAGFWLSFGAVAVLLWLFVGHGAPANPWTSLPRAQAGLMLAMLPMSLTWFRFASISALGANLLAIPFMSAVTLPLVLLGLLTLAIPWPPATIPLHMAAQAAAWLEALLVTVHRLGGDMAWQGPSPPLGVALAATLGALLCLLPGALRLRGFGVLLILPLLWPPQPPQPGALHIDVLDVGQGQAVLVRSEAHVLLVDTGPGAEGRWSLAQRVILPAITDAAAGPLDLLLVSHGDSDHAGGLDDLRAALPGVPVIASLGPAPTAARQKTPITDAIGLCHDERRWRWRSPGPASGTDIEFRVLHPTRWLPYRGNDSSCVLDIRAPGGAVLLPGDIGHRVERRLASTQAAPRAGYRLVVAPHHGSRTSSSGPFLRWARPAHTVFTTGYANRFGFPAAEVLARYGAQALPVVDTASCGALRFVLHADGGLVSDSARAARSGFWRFPPAPHCPGAGAPWSLTSVNAFRYHAGHPEKTSASQE